MTLKRFILIDLLILSLIFLVVETIVWRFGFINVNFWVSISIPMILAGMIRWRYEGLIMVGIAATAHGIYQYLGGSSVEEIVIAIFSVCSVAVFIVLRPYLIKNIYKFSVLSTGYLMVYIVYLVVTWILSTLLIQTSNPIELLIYHLLNMLIGILLLGLMSKQNTFLIDMRDYLRKKD
jgi:hypothetical protein